MSSPQQSLVPTAAVAERNCSRCAQCKSGADRCQSEAREEAPGPEEAGGPIARRPWIWIALGYTAFLGVMFAFVWIALTHLDPTVPITDQATRPGALPRAAEGAGAAQSPRSPVAAPVSSTIPPSAEAHPAAQ